MPLRIDTFVVFLALFFNQLEVSVRVNMPVEFSAFFLLNRSTAGDKYTGFL